MRRTTLFEAVFNSFVQFHGELKEKIVEQIRNVTPLARQEAEELLHTFEFNDVSNDIRRFNLVKDRVKSLEYLPYAKKKLVV